MNETIVPKIGSRWRLTAGGPLHIESGKIYTVDGYKKFPRPMYYDVIHTITFKELSGKRYDCAIFSGMEEIKISEKLELI